MFEVFRVELSVFTRFSEKMIVRPEEDARVSIAVTAFEVCDTFLSDRQHSSRSPIG